MQYWLGPARIESRSNAFRVGRLAWEHGENVGRLGLAAIKCDEIVAATECAVPRIHLQRAPTHRITDYTTELMSSSGGCDSAPGRARVAGAGSERARSRSRRLTARDGSDPRNILRPFTKSRAPDAAGCHLLQWTRGLGCTCLRRERMLRGREALVLERFRLGTGKTRRT